MRGLLYRAVVPPLRAINRAARWALSALHLLQYRTEGFLRPDAEWFDHQLDVYWQWPARRRSSFLERGVLSSLAINDGARVLDLCCGDGFYTARFYAPRAASVIGLDANPAAIAHAHRVNPAPNVQFVLGDVLGALPAGPFDNVIWDGALPHFSEHDVQRILTSVRHALRPGGVLSGQVPHEAGNPYSYFTTAFPDADSLAEVLGQAFPFAFIRQTTDGPRRNYYFFCSDDETRLPFSPGNTDVIVRSSR